ncbi:MAG TPA: FUSC family protein, partial [Solirubrobacterales bacterium]
TNRTVEQLRGDAQTIRANFSRESPAGRHAVRLAVVVPLAELVSRELPIQRGYWMVVAAATVLRPEFGATFTRGTERALGTALGVALAGGLAVGLHPVGAVTVVIVGLLAWAGYALFPASFAVGFAFITALVVFLLNAIAPDTLSTASARLLDTLIGGALGLVVYAAWPTWSAPTARRALADLIAAQRAYIVRILAALAAGRRARDLGPLSRRARLARTSAEATVGRSLAEPVEHRIDPNLSQSVLAAARRLVLAAHVVRLDAEEERERAPLPELSALADGLERLLSTVEHRLRADEDGSAAAPGDAARPLPDLRAAYNAVAEHDGGHPEAEALLAELDEIVDAANGLAALVGLDPAA